MEDSEIQEMLEEVGDRVQGSALEFIESLAFQYHHKGYLTEKQQLALLKFYENL